MEKTTNRQRVRRIESFLGISKSGDLPQHSVRDQINALHGQVQEMNQMIQRLVDKQRNEESSSNGENSKEVNADLTFLKEEVTVLRKAMGSDNQPPSGVERVKLPEPKTFDGIQDLGKFHMGLGTLLQSQQKEG